LARVNSMSSCFRAALPTDQNQRLVLPIDRCSGVLRGAVHH
jgi:hypothetical protein